MENIKTTVGLSLTRSDKELLLRYCSPRTVSMFVKKLLHEHHFRILYGKQASDRRITRIEEKLNTVLDKLEVKSQSCQAITT